MSCIEIRFRSPGGDPLTTIADQRQMATPPSEAARALNDAEGLIRLKSHLIIGRCLPPECHLLNAVP